MLRALLAAAASLALVGAACESDRETRSDERRTQEADAPRDDNETVCEQRGPWSCTDEAAWLRGVLRVAGYRVVGTTGSALIVRGRRSSFFIWTTEAVRPIRETARASRFGARLSGVPIYGDQNRVVWRAQRLNVWLERGPRGDAELPPRAKLATLVVTTKLLPRMRMPVGLMPTPAGALRECRRSKRMRPACPAHVPRVPVGRIDAGLYRDFPNAGAQAFNLQWGGEHPGRPELNRPPGMLHLVILAGPLVSPPYGLTDEQPVRDGVLRETRKRGLLFGSVRWGSRTGELVLAPPYGLGGIEGNHLIFRWRAGKEKYALSLHAWEPFHETLSALRGVIESLPEAKPPVEAGASPDG
ncbi:MAG: hypothetical protein M3188_03465 [Actinomycetota bacterium]|nr:hypothetical protein [Actinomycetota bacterium]